MRARRERQSSGKGTDAGLSEASYLHHGDHPIVGNGVGADGEVAARVSADDPVVGVPVRGMRLVSVYHCQISHHHIHLVFWDLAGEL